MYKFRYTPTYTSVEPVLPQAIIDKVFLCVSYYYGYFDYKKHIRTSYPIKNKVSWCFYDYQKNDFPSGFLGEVVKELKEEEYKIEVINEQKAPLFDFTDFFEDYLFNSGIQLRPFQKVAADMAVEYGNGILEVGTGGGKTLIYGDIIQKLGTSTLFLTIDLQSKNQTYKEFIQYFGEDCVELIENIDFSNENFEHDYPIVVANIQNCWAKLKRFPKEFTRFLNSRNLLLVNECHHINESNLRDKLENTWFKLAMATPAFYRIGATGTVGKEGSLQRKLLQGAIGDIIYSKPTKELIAEGYAVPIEAHIYKMESNNSEHIEYTKAFENMLSEDGFLDKIVKIARYYAKDKKVLIFCEWVEKQAFKIMQRLAGEARLIYGSTKEEERIKTLADFEKGEFPILISTVFSEDFNFPALDVGVIIGKKKNEKILKQRVGRLARLFEGKDKGIIVIPFIQDWKEVEIEGETELRDGILAKHSKAAISILKKEGHTIIDKDLKDI